MMSDPDPRFFFRFFSMVGSASSFCFLKVGSEFSLVYLLEGRIRIQLYFEGVIRIRNPCYNLSLSLIIICMCWDNLVVNKYFICINYVENLDIHSIIISSLFKIQKYTNQINFEVCY